MGFPSSKPTYRGDGPVVHATVELVFPGLFSSAPQPADKAELNLPTVESTLAIWSIPKLLQVVLHGLHTWHMNIRTGRLGH